MIENNIAIWSHCNAHKTLNEKSVLSCCCVDFESIKKIKQTDVLGELRGLTMFDLESNQLF